MENTSPWLKTGIISGIVVIFLYILSIIYTAIKLDITVLNYLIILFMWFFRISETIIDSLFLFILLIAFIISGIILIFNKEKNLKKFGKYLIIVVPAFLVIFYIIPVFLHWSSFIFGLIDLYEKIPSSICCPPGHLQGSAFSWIIHGVIIFLFYSVIGSAVGWVIQKFRGK